MIKTHYLALALMALLSACAESEIATNATEGTAQAEAPPTPVGATAKAEGIDFTVTDVASTSSIGPAGAGFAAEKGETFVIASYTVKNTSSDTLAFLERPAITLIDGKGRSYAPDEMATAMSAGTMSDPSGIVADLNSNVSAKSKSAWKVDATAFDKATWRLVVKSDPQLTFALQ